MLHLLALVGILTISFSAVFVRMADVSPVTAAFYRAAYAIPALALIWARAGAVERRSSRARALAMASGLLLALDLALWHRAIVLIGVGLATVIANIQVVFVAVLAWALYGDRVTRRTMAIVAAVLGGLALTSGLSRPDAYGANPVLGTLLGAGAGACYAGFLLTFRAANRKLAPSAGPLLDSTIGTAAGALLLAPFDPGFAFTIHMPAHAWLITLALVSQVFGWLLIASALPRLPALETSILLLVQPVFSLLWGVVFFAEYLSPLQWAGAAIVLAGIGRLQTEGRSKKEEGRSPTEVRGRKLKSEVEVGS